MSREGDSHRLSEIDEDNLRSVYTHLSNHLRASEERQTQLFLFCITVSAAIVGLGNSEAQGQLPDPLQCATIAVLSGVVAFLMGRHRLWKLAIWKSLEEIEEFWGVPQDARMESRLGPRVTNVGSELAMRVIVIVLALVSAIFAFQDNWIPGLPRLWGSQ